MWENRVMLGLNVYGSPGVVKLRHRSISLGGIGWIEELSPMVSIEKITWHGIAPVPDQIRRSKMSITGWMSRSDLSPATPAYSV